MKRVQGKVAIVTGGASGLGLASCERLAEEGATVVMADVAAAQRSEQASRLEGVSYHYQDVTAERGWEALVAAV